MSGEVVGQAVNAVLAPPQAERFAGVAGVDLSRLALNVTGWNKLVLLDSDRVFLFPRSAIGVEWFERELAVYRALAKTQLGVVPRLLGRWEDPEIYPFPFAAVTRLRGEVPADGIIDWETARVDHPFWDFGEWGTGLWRRRRRDFSALRTRGWRAYAQARGLDVDSGPLEAAFRLRHAIGLLADPGDPAVVGTLEEHLAQL
jgi:hypothetical protein